MTTIQKIRIAVVITCGVAVGAIAVLHQNVQTPAKNAIDPSIPAITITAKRLTAEEKLQWAKEDADLARRNVTAKKSPAQQDTAPRMIPVADRG